MSAGGSGSGGNEVVQERAVGTRNRVGKKGGLLTRWLTVDLDELALFRVTAHIHSTGINIRHCGHLISLVRKIDNPHNDSTVFIIRILVIITTKSAFPPLISRPTLYISPYLIFARY